MRRSIEVEDTGNFAHPFVNRLHTNGNASVPKNGHAPLHILDFEHPVEPQEMLRAKYPLIDAHNHLGPWSKPDGSWPLRRDEIPALVARMDQQNIQAIVNLDATYDGTWELLSKILERYDYAYPGRFYTFFNIDGQDIDHVVQQPNFGEILASRLTTARDYGVYGLKIHKGLGMRYRDNHNRLIGVDDKRLEPLWETAASLHIPVLIHTADPKDFWKPYDENNPRYQELKKHPDWHYYGRDIPPFEQLMEQFERFTAANPWITIIGAHLVDAENVPWVIKLLETYPNLSVDTGARFGEMGEQGDSIKDLFEKHSDRIIFGLDNGGDGHGPQPVAYSPAIRYLQTDDRDFNYAPEGEEQFDHGEQTIDGINLPDPTLQMVYNENISRLLRLSTPVSHAA